MTDQPAIIVQKFGGSSLATLDDVLRCAEHVVAARQRGHEVVVVVSAMGGRTDELLEMIRRVGGSRPCAATDALLASGEQQAAAIMTLTLQGLGERVDVLSPTELGILTDGQFGSALIRQVDCARLQRALAAHGIVVVPGFQGIGPDGRVRTIGRGGSDTTAVAIAAAIRASGRECRCEVYSNVSGVHSADPNLIAHAQPLGDVDAEWMARYAGEGAKVLHDRAAVLAAEEQLPVQLGCSRTGRIGTVVRPQRCHDLTRVTACTLRRLFRVELMSQAAGLPPIVEAVGTVDCSMMRWADAHDPGAVTVLVEQAAASSLAERFAHSHQVDIEVLPVAVVAAVGPLDARFGQRAMQAHTRLCGSIDSVCSFELDPGIARWMASEHDAERLYARVHDAMVVAATASESDAPLVEVARRSKPRAAASMTA